MLRTVVATRYVTPLREGGSLPAIVEGDDLGLYVLKFRGAGQGPLALVAELVAGEIGRVLGLAVPELVLMEVDTKLGRNEPDKEIRDLLQASTGLNLALDYLPGSLMFDAAALPVPKRIDPVVASSAVWFDAFITNVDRTPRNPNLLWWHKVLYFIDHGASLYFHHNWQSLEAIEQSAMSRFPAIRDHVLMPWASQLGEVDPMMRARLTEHVIQKILEQVPDAWLVPDSLVASWATTPEQRRAGYVAFFKRRLELAAFVEEAVIAHARLI